MIAFEATEESRREARSFANAPSPAACARSRAVGPGGAEPEVVSVTGFGVSCASRFGGLTGAADGTTGAAFNSATTAGGAGGSAGGAGRWSSTILIGAGGAGASVWTSCGTGSRKINRLSTSSVARTRSWMRR